MSRSGPPTSLAETDGSIADKLEIARKDLLDLGLRNSLLNYRLLRSRGVEVVDQLSADVFRILVRDAKVMSFVPVPEKTANAGLSQPGEQPTGGVAARHIDLRLQTAESSSKLQSRLLATYYAARTSIEEQGVNTLFLALGMLQWYEAEDSSTLRRAPLLLIPVELSRSNARERFQVRYNGEEIGSNLSLEEKLRREFAITMPAMPDVEDLDVDQYLAEVSGAILSQPAWSVAPNEIALGFFSFAKLLMFKDLEASRWPPSIQPSDHSILQSLLGEGFREPPSSYSDADHLDRIQEAMQLSPVMDTDSSQALAILDVKSGRNMVIQGPPGTGKSQTITNLIAEAIADGKSVLFVAEKLAALQVVKRRLDKIGLGDACLELHSHNTQKKALLEELRRTLELGQPRDGEVEGDRDRLIESRDKLNAYSEAVNTAIHESGVTPYRALGEVVRIEQQGPDALKRMALSEITSWDEKRFRKLLATVEDLQVRLAASGAPSEHPFWGSRRTVFTPMDASQLRERLVATQQAIAQVEQAGRRLAHMGEATDPTCRSEVEGLFPPAWQLWRRWFGKDKAARARAREALTQHQERIRAILEFLDMDEAALFGEVAPLAEWTFEKQARIVEFWLEHAGDLGTLAAVNEVVEECRRQGMAAVVEQAGSWPGARDRLVHSFRHSYFLGLLETAYAERPPLARFNRESHERTLAEFRRIDQLLTRYNSARLAGEHWRRLPSLHNGGGQLAVLKHEFEKKTRHMPIRQLMIRAGRPIQAMKPVFMMSPLSIANYLPPGSLTFDLVIFDEASQVKPVDAFGAILRGQRAVVVGDSRQLPPTSFFDALTIGNEEDEEIATSDIESVLGLFLAQLAPERMLRWHYRSRHESLIAVSNHAFYNDRLVVFPSPDAARQNAGLAYHHLPESNYDRGGTRANQIEAERVARAVMGHGRNQPHLSLGVAAFSVAQMKAIQDQLEILRREDASCEHFFASAHPHEQFFVKNLETVQGDERDVIFISVGYGRTKEGYLSMSFGPLNGDGGERRLNVLITRARVRCEVFTNLRADDIQDEGRSPGVCALKTFLKYAETGQLDVPRVTDGEADSPFEEAVCDELTKLGYTVRKQVGSAGFRIDLAVVDPDSPGRYLLGVECDGAAYHSARSARDRDRLRQAVLEGLGWRIHRVWSTDWFRNPRQEMQRLVAAIERAKTAGVHSEERAPPVENILEHSLVREQAPRSVGLASTVPLYRTAQLVVNTRGVGMHAIPTSTLADWIGRVVEVESPVHISEAMHRVTEAAGVRRLGSRIESAMRRAAAHAARNGLIRIDGDFLWSSNSRAVPVRDRTCLPVGSRRLEFVAPEELRAAIEKATEDAYGIGLDEIPGAVCRLLGFARVSDEMRSHVEQYVRSLLQEGCLVQQGAYVTRPAAR